MILGWLYAATSLNTVLSKMIIAQFIILAMMVTLIHVQDYHFVPRIVIMGHFLSFYLAIAGSKLISERLAKASIQKAKNWVHMFICLITITISFSFSKSIKEIIIYGVLDYPIDTQTVVIDQRRDLTFPICVNG